MTRDGAGASRSLQLGYLCAGSTNFGALQGACNHSQRLTNVQGVSNTAIVDANTALAKIRLANLQEGGSAISWKDAQLVADPQDMLASQTSCPEAVIIGLQPNLHGAPSSTKVKALDVKDLEIQVAKAGLHMLIEPPLSSQPLKEANEAAKELQHLQKEKNLIIAAGYMLRYSAAVVEAKRILAEVGAKAVVVTGRCVVGYSLLDWPGWWDKRINGGLFPQAHHIIDLMRCFGGDVVSSSVQATALDPIKLALSGLTKDSPAEKVPREHCINPATSAVMIFSSGGLGSFTCSALLHQQACYGELELIGDGIRLMLKDLFGKCTLHKSAPGAEDCVEVALDVMDPYKVQLEAFLMAVRSSDEQALKSNYADACMTHKAVLDIVNACDGHKYAKLPLEE